MWNAPSTRPTGCNRTGAASFGERARVLEAALARTEAEAEHRARLYVRENGKTLAEARREIGSVPARGRLTLGLAAELDTPRRLPAPAGRSEVRPRPYGVVSAIVPWNAPVPLASMQIIPALLAYNAVVLKVPETAPLALTRTLELMHEVLPRGLLNVVAGASSVIGTTLTQHPLVNRIAFVGSIPAGRRIIADAYQGIRGVVTELGGNDAAIVMEDMTFDDATMDRMAGVIFRMAGQVCMAIKRIYVPAHREAAFVEALGAAMDRIRVGNGLTPGVTMGSVHNRAGLQNARALVAEAEAAGAQVRELGVVEDEAAFERGYFMRPTMVTGVGDGARVVAEEQFGPVIPVLTYTDLEDAIRRANDSVFGLGGSVWGDDVERAADVAWRLQAGTVFVNTHGTESVNRSAPYGGVKQSGNGRRSGLEGVQEYLVTQTLTTYET
ncbi:aldehyde dehydrogenase family protein [Arenibacterium sp. LLYu02]|uniref:aldehyde dehydrogenase family protein n=1 Tax=Arenibacterium sp. LLYu02 TaxID=3404132 RepID=UPI003B221AB1